MGLLVKKSSVTSTYLGLCYDQFPQLGCWMLSSSSHFRRKPENTWIQTSATRVARAIVPKEVGLARVCKSWRPRNSRTVREKASNMASDPIRKGYFRRITAHYTCNQVQTPTNHHQGVICLSRKDLDEGPKKVKFVLAASV